MDVDGRSGGEGAYVFIHCPLRRWLTLRSFITRFVVGTLSKVKDSVEFRK